MRTFSKKEAIGFGWNTTKQHLGFFIVLLIIAWLLQFVPGYALDYLVKNMQLVQGLTSRLILGIFEAILSWLVGMGLIYISLKFVDNRETKVADLFSCFNLLLKYGAASVLYGLIIVVGFILLIVPGIIWSIKFQYYSYLIVDKQLGPIEALKQSSKITQGVKWQLFAFGALLVLINLLGVLALIVGLFAAIPTTMLAAAFVYRRLLSQSKV